MRVNIMLTPEEQTRAVAMVNAQHEQLLALTADRPLVQAVALKVVETTLQLMSYLPLDVQKLYIKILIETHEIGESFANKQ